MFEALLSQIEADAAAIRGYEICCLCQIFGEDFEREFWKPFHRHGVQIERPVEKMRSFWLNLSLFWKCQILCWTAFALVTIPVKTHLFGSYSGASVSLYRDGMGFLMTFALHEVYRRISFRRVRIAWILATIIVLSAAGGILQTFLSQTIEHIPPFNRARLSDDTITIVVYYYRIGLLFSWSLIYFVLRLIYEGRDTDSRLFHAVAAHRETELQMLRVQMNPHFLFNALNAIAAMVGKSGMELKALIQSLSDYLRFSLDHGADALIPLGTEYDAMRDYLAIEKSRFSDDLEIECHIDEAARPVAVPGIILQPLVENAIKYGRETSELPLKVRVKVSRPDATAVRIDVRNTGYWTDLKSRGKSSHLGLKNLRRRLELLYADRHRLEITDDDGWVTVNINIPTV